LGNAVHPALLIEMRDEKDASDSHMFRSAINTVFAVSPNNVREFSTRVGVSDRSEYFSKKIRSNYYPAVRQYVAFFAANASELRWLTVCLRPIFKKRFLRIQLYGSPAVSMFRARRKIAFYTKWLRQILKRF
jgi:hypothetical protein